MTNFSQTSATPPATKNMANAQNYLKERRVK